MLHAQVYYFLENSETHSQESSDLDRRIAGLQQDIRQHLHELQSDFWSLFTCCRRNQVINFIDTDFEELNQLIRIRRREHQSRENTLTHTAIYTISFQNNLEDLSSHIRESWLGCPITVSSIIAHFADGEFQECDYCDAEISLTHSDMYKYETTGQRFAAGYCCDECEFCDECDGVQNNIWRCAECEMKLCKQCLPPDLESNFCNNCNQFH